MKTIRAWVSIGLVLLSTVVAAQRPGMGTRFSTTSIFRWINGSRSTLTSDALDFQELLYGAQSQRGTTRSRRLREADAALDALRLYLRLAHRWRWLNDGQYRHVSGMVAEIGSLLGGWMRAKK